MSKGTVIYIGGFELPDKNAAANRVVANAKIFRDLGYSTILVGIDKEDRFTYSLEENRFNEYTYQNNVCLTKSYPETKYKWLKYLVDINDFLFLVNKYSDIKAVICYNYQSPALNRIINYCKKNNIKVISDCTEWYGKTEGNIFFRGIKYIDTALRMKVVNRRVDGLILVSNYLKKYYTDKTSVVIPTLVNNDTTISPTFNEQNRVKLVYAGIPFRLGKELKNKELAKDRLDLTISLMYEIFKKNINFELNIYGITKDDYLEVIPSDNEIINKMGEAIIFHGNIAHNILQSEINKSDFSIMLRDDNRTTQAGFPTKFTESINLYVPVITTDTSDLANYLVEGKNGYFLEIDNKEKSIEKLISILSKDKIEINSMKTYIKNTNIFNIGNWEKEVKIFFNNVGV